MWVIMKIRALQFVEFAYGDKRKDKSKVSQILSKRNMIPKQIVINDFGKP